MTALIYIVAALLMGQAGAEVVDLKCGDNATCINDLGRKLYTSIKQHKTVRLFDVLTIEPLKTRQARSNKGALTGLLTSHAISFDWNDFTFRFSNPEDKDESMDLEIFENRSSKDEPEPVVKKSVSKTEDVTEEKLPKMRIKRKKVHKRKVLQAVIPLLFGMKSTGAVMFAMAMVTAITLKAFFASKLALVVTIGMAIKKFYESYSNGIGLPNNPYLYSQYPIDFPSASSQAYSVNGVNTQFASPEMYNPTALGSQSHSHEIMQQNEVTAQQSQQSPTLLLNSTRSASERWDGKSKFLKFLEPVFGSLRNVLEPIANVFYAMPATFRGLNSDVTTTSSTDENVDDINKKEFLIPQPRFIAQRKMNYRMVPRTKKYTELKVNLDRLRHNKDLHDYIKTKKYKFNYPVTYYYPRVKYFVNPNTFTIKPNNSRLSQYQKQTLKKNETIVENNNDLVIGPSDWKPIIVPIINNTTNVPSTKKASRRKQKRKHKRTKRSLSSQLSDNNKYYTRSFNLRDNNNQNLNFSGRGFMKFLQVLFEPLTIMFTHAEEFTSNLLKISKKDKNKPPFYYTLAYNLVMYSLDMIAGTLDVTEEINKKYIGNLVKKKSKGKSKTKDKINEPKINVTSKF